MYRTKYLALVILIVALVGCGRMQKEEQAQKQPPAPQQPAAQQPPAPQAAPQAMSPEAAPQPLAGTGQPATAQPANEPSPVTAQTQPSVPSAASVSKPAAPVNPRPTETAAAPAPALPPKPVYAVVPSGTRIEVRLDGPLSSVRNRDGDTFSSTLDQDLVIDGRVLADRGSTVAGKVISTTSSGRVKGRANMAIALTEIKVGNVAHAIHTNTLSFEAEGTEKQDALKVGGGAGLGAIIGAIAGGKKGAAIGAAVGGGAGTATVLATKGKEVKFEAEQKFSFVLRDEFKIRIH